MQYSKHLTNLIIHCFENDKFDDDFYILLSKHCLTFKSQTKDTIRTQAIKLLTSYPKKITKQLINNSYLSYYLNDTYLEKLCSTRFSKYISFVIFGCPYSTDIDVACIVNNYNNCHPMPLLKTEYLRMINELTEIGYDIDKLVIDINYIVIENKNVIAMSKGGNEIQNMILSTYDLHKQKYECPDLNYVAVSKFEKIRCISKYMLDNMEYISNKYDKNIKIELYNEGTVSIIKHSKKLLDYLSFNILDLKWKDVIKSLVMKYIQLILMTDNIYEYTKLELAKKISLYYDDPNLEKYAKWYLFRGSIEDSVFSEMFLTLLHNKYVEIVNEYLNEIKPTHDSIDKSEIISKITKFPFVLEFVNSPHSVTADFIEKWKTYEYDNMSLNEMFIIKSGDDICRNDILKILEEKNKNKFIWIDQRSSEWLYYLTYYVCGKNSKIIIDTIEAKYNLIRGSLTEHIINELYDFNKIPGLEKFKKCNVGLIVENKEIKGSRGCSPDMLLYSDDEIIPVEIKCLTSNIKNHDYFRGLELAKRQCNNVKDILNDVSVKRNLILLTYWTNDKLMIEYFLNKFI